LTAHQDTAG